MKKIRTAVIGASGMGYINTLRHFNVIDIAGLWDLNSPLRAAQGVDANVHYYESFEEILSDPEIILVINVMNPLETAEYSRRLLESGKHVFVSKLIAENMDKGRELVDLAAEKGLMLACGPDCFMNGGMQTVRWMIDRGVAGNIRSASVMLNRSSLLFGEFLPYLFQKDGSILHDVGAYYIEPLIEFFGPVEQVSAFGGKTTEVYHPKMTGGPLFGKELPLLDFNVFAVNMRFRNGVIATLNYNGGTDVLQSCDFSLYGDKGIIVMGHPHDYDTPVKLMTPNASFGADTVVVPFNHGFTKDVHFGVAAAEMAWALVSGRKSRQTAETALHLLEIIKGIEKSADEGGTVYRLETTMERQEPLPEGFISPMPMLYTEESALI